jgi:hypothetical protein
MGIELSTHIMNKPALHLVFWHQDVFQTVILAHFVSQTLPVEDKSVSERTSPSITTYAQKFQLM